ncbi:hypothetical protein [Coleofasciculus chthonoplastes]|jgi:N12 class adenine-specific DNA methylase|uniref:hypothetical protein n=1 Tax=Coleofasciculus chthonoplastes TaxID=64178 RepID=UPI0032F71637
MVRILAIEDEESVGENILDRSKSVLIYAKNVDNNHKKILMIEDEEAVRENLMELLEAKEFNDK